MEGSPSSAHYYGLIASRPFTIVQGDIKQLRSFFICVYLRSSVEKYVFMQPLRLHQKKSLYYGPFL